MKNEEKRAKPVSAATRAMLDAMEEDASRPVAEDKLAAIRRRVAELREAELEAARLKESLTAQNILINDLLWSKLPQIMDEAGVPNIGIAADGNKPPYEVRVDDHYKANIPEEHAPAAFAYLEKTKHDDLIKTTYTVSFGLREGGAARKFETALFKMGVPFSKKQGVPWNTLTAWFKVEQRKKPLSAKTMEILGASVGRVASVVKLKEKK